MLLGQFGGKLSAKRRMVVPRKLAKELGSPMIIAKWYEGCLVLVSTESWGELLKKVRGTGELITSMIRDVDRFIAGSAFEVEIDELGRIIVPDLLADYAGLKEDVIFLGLSDRVEIWSQQVWREKEKRIADQAAVALEKIAHEEKNPRAGNDS